MKHKRYRGRRVTTAKKSFWSEFGGLLVMTAVVVVLFRVILQLAWVPSGSMETTIPEKSLLVSLRLPYLLSDPQPERGDIVTFWSDELDKLLVKRVVGLPGDEISFEGGYVCINGKQIDEPYVRQQGKTESPGNEVFKVPEGCLFMMGDNRAGSEDSRFWTQHYVPVESVRAKVMVILSVHKDNSWRGVRLAG